MEKYMKKIALITALLLSSTSAFAHGNWVGPALIGGIIGYEIGRPAQVYQQPQIIYQQPQVVYVQPRQVIVIPANAPTPYGYRCELQSVYVNGQVVLNNYCY